MQSAAGVVASIERKSSLEANTPIAPVMNDGEAAARRWMLRLDRPAPAGGIDPAEGHDF
jgi:hypothetical protein